MELIILVLAQDLTSMFKGLFFGSPGNGNTLDSILIENDALGCDPLLGQGKLTWVLSGSVPGSYVELAYDFGTGYTDYNIFIDPALGIFLFDVSGLLGFTSLDSTNFRVRWTLGGVDISGSPLFLGPTYPCA